MTAIRKLSVLALLFAAASLTACEKAPVPTEPSYKETPARPNLTLSTGETFLNALWGRVILSNVGDALEIVAAATNKGTAGYGKDGIVGTVIELVPPSVQYAYWCVNLKITSDPSLVGFNVLFYIKDVGNGRTSFDEVAGAGGFGLSCASHPAPTSNDTPFAPVVSGNFWTAQIRR